MSASSFAQIVFDELDAMPVGIARFLDNVEVVVADRPTPRQADSVALGRGEVLYGLYEGIPMTERGGSYSLVLPDRITIFRLPILSSHRTVAAVRTQVRRTVIHELAHHFGIDDERLVELGGY